MIVTITMNPALDKSTTVEKLIPEKKLRCSAPSIEAGGGGINVSKAVKELGGEAVAVFPAGGINGQVLKQFLYEQMVPFQAVDVKAETRESFTASETFSNSQFRFIMPGEKLTGAEVEACFSAIENLHPFPSILIASGSLPEGVPDDFLARLAELSRAKDSKFILDTSGKPLQLAVQHGVYLLKPNLSELSSLVGKSYLQFSEIEDAARQVMERSNCRVVVVSTGRSGAVLVTKDSMKRIYAPTVRQVSAVGAGDSMVAGMAWVLDKGGSHEEMVTFGVACGTAATMTPGTQLFRKEDAFAVYEWMQHQNR